LIEGYCQLFARAADATAKAMHGGGRYFDPKDKPVDEVIAFFRSIVVQSEL
jgi:hypothetical protein